ncbi:MAG TPA: ATP-binding protein [Vicinamibacteria bacterium]|jgi:PAS domain S-box-containing protein
MQDEGGSQHGSQGLAESEERYRLISQIISDYTFSTRINPDGTLFHHWVAGAFERITGYGYEEYMARGGWLAALHPDDREQDARDMEALRANRQVVTEVRTFMKSGEMRWVRVWGHPVWDPVNNQLVGIYGAVQDITDRKKVEAEREALIRELEAKNAELERFAYTVSHDLKSPLITIRGFLSFVEQDAESGNLERVRADLGRIRDAVDKMQRLLSELLELSRIGRVVNPPQTIAFGGLAQDALALVAGRLRQRGVGVAVAEGLPTVWGDRARLVEVMQNLVDNAAKFMGDQRHPRVEIGMREQAGERVFFVRDNGIGIDPRFRDRVFGLFEKLDPDSEGSGVGLALIKRIVDQHHGRVWVESEGKGKGTTVCFTLPDATAASAPTAAPSSVAG